MMNMNLFKDLFTGIQLDLDNAQAYVSDGHISAAIDLSGEYLDRVHAITAIEDDDERYAAGSALEEDLEADASVWEDLYEASGYVYDEETDKMVPYNQAVELMDDDLREEIHADLAPCTSQEFFDEYCKRHIEKFGESFEVN